MLSAYGSNRVLRRTDGTRTVIDHLHTGLPQLPPHSLHNFLRPVGYRKDTAAPLCLQRDAHGLKICHDICRAEPADSADHKPAVGQNLIEHLTDRTVVCQIAAAFSGNPQFFPGISFISFHQDNTQALLRSHG